MRVRDAEDRRRGVLEISDSAMAAGGGFFGRLQRELAVAMADYSEDELAVVRRFLEEMVACWLLTCVLRAPNRAAYSLGDVPRLAWKQRRMVSPLPNPARRAVWVTVQPR